MLKDPGFQKAYKALLNAQDDQGLRLGQGSSPTKPILAKRSKLLWPFVRKYGIISQRVEQAVAKPIRYPASQRGPFAFPALAKLKAVTRFLLLDVEAQVAAKKNDVACNRLLAAMKVGRSLQGLETIPELVGVAIWAMALASLDLGKDAFRASEWSRFETYAESCLKPPFSISKVIEEQILELPKTVASLGSPREALDFLVTYDSENSRERPAPQVIKDLTEGRAAKIVRLGADQARRNLRRQLEWLRQPEATWWANFTRYPKDEPDPLKAETEDDLVAAVHALLALDNRQLVRNIMLLRTQQRLVVLQGKLRTYRERKGRYPETLEAVAGKERLLDPFSNKPFHYRPLPNGSFELYSHGVKATGRILMRYRPAFSIAKT